MKESHSPVHTYSRSRVAFVLAGLALAVSVFCLSMPPPAAIASTDAGVTMLLQASVPARSGVWACLRSLNVSGVPDTAAPDAIVIEITARQRSTLEACGVLFNWVRPFVLLESTSPASLNLASSYAENDTNVPFATFSVQSVVTVTGAPLTAMIASTDLYYKLVIKPGVPWNGVDAVLQSSNKTSYDWICGRHHPTAACFIEWNATNRDWLNGTAVNGGYMISIDTPSDLTAESYLDFWSLRLYYNEPTATPTPRVGAFRAMLPILLLRVN
jgi:hypothetical protein